jgi:hypothetical protein
LRKIFTLFILVGGLASATISYNTEFSTPNLPYELSSPGGSFSVGIGPNYTQFDLLPFDVELDPGGAITTFDIGTVTLPQIADINDLGVLAGELQMTYQDITVQDEVWSMTLDAGGGNLDWGLQMSGIVLNNQDEQYVSFWFHPVVGKPGTVQSFDVDVQLVSIEPEPGTWGLIVIGVLLLSSLRLQHWNRA